MIEYSKARKWANMCEACGELHPEKIHSLTLQHQTPGGGRGVRISMCFGCLTELTQRGLEYMAVVQPIVLKPVDLNECPGCGGDADNGHDRCVPPSPYYCTKCNPDSEDGD